MTKYKHFIPIFLFIFISETSYADVCARGLSDDESRRLVMYLLEGNQEKVNSLLQSDKIDVDARDDTGKTILMIYLSELEPDAYILDVVEALIQKGADINAQDNNGDTPLHYNKSPHVARILIREKADIHAQNKKSRTPLHDTNNLYIARILIREGARVEARDESGNTPIHDADINLAKVLVEEFGANPHAENDYGRKPISSFYFQIAEEVLQL